MDKAIANQYTASPKNSPECTLWQFERVAGLYLLGSSAKRLEFLSAFDEPAADQQLKDFPSGRGSIDDLA